MDFEDVKEFKKYKKMFKEKNNYGYCEWSKGIKEKLSEMPEEELINCFKRIKMRHEMLRLAHTKDNDLPHINNFIMVVVSISSLFLSIFVVWEEVLKDYEINTAAYFPDTVEALLNAITRSNQIFGVLMSFVIEIEVIILITILILWIRNKQRDKGMIEKITYYGELNELLKKELERRNILLYFL